MITNYDVAAQCLLPHDLLTSVDVHLTFRVWHWQNHHRIISVIHSVNFVAFNVSYSCSSLLNHWNADRIGYCSYVRDFLSGEDAFKRETSLGRAVLSRLGFRDAQDLVCFIIYNTKTSNFEGSDFDTVGSWHEPTPWWWLMTVRFATLEC